MSSKRAKEIIEAARRNGHLQMLEDGRQWYCPEAGMAFDSFALRAIADGLDRINRQWDEVARTEASRTTMAQDIAAQIEGGGYPRVD